MTSVAHDNSNHTKFEELVCQKTVNMIFFCVKFNVKYLNMCFGDEHMPQRIETA